MEKYEDGCEREPDQGSARSNPGYWMIRMTMRRKKKIELYPLYNMARASPALNTKTNRYAPRDPATTNCLLVAGSSDINHFPIHSALERFKVCIVFTNIVDFFIQASSYTFFNSRYDSSSFLFDLTRNFRGYCSSHVSNMFIFRSKVHH